MNLTLNAIINSYSIVLLIVIYIYSLKKGEKLTYQYQLYIVLVQLTILILFFDIFGRFDGNVGTIYPFLNSIGNFLIFLLQPILPSIWLMYVFNQAYYDNKERIRRLYVPLFIINFFNAAMVIISQFIGWYYSIDANNTYHRGPLYSLSSIISIFLLLTATVFIFVNRKKFDKKYYFSLIFFAVPPLTGIILQVFIYGISFALCGTVLSLLIVLLNIQNQSIYTDYLTGIGNRSKLEAVLENKISSSSKDKTFALIMLDVDNFKYINDTFGHDMGDHALKEFSELLKKCVRSKDYLTRFGGDEFCLILDISDPKILEKAVERINQNVNSFNETKALPYHLSLSMGYAIYDYQLQFNAEKFLKQVDTLMYQNKSQRRQEETMDQNYQLFSDC